MKAKIQTSKDKTWIDESGIQIPSNRITPAERLKEKNAGFLVKKALGLQSILVAFKEEIANKSDEVLSAVVGEVKATKDTKGNYTWYNFDRSVKIEVSVNERIAFDDLEIMACQEKLNKYIAENVTTTEPLVTELVESAFSRKNGNLDAKKVMSLLKYKERVKAPLFLEAMKHLEASIRRPDSKTYYRIALRNEEGKYENIDTNLSSL